MYFNPWVIKFALIFKPLKGMAFFVRYLHTFKLSKDVVIKWYWFIPIENDGILKL